jgi:hypothetical protein
MDADTEIAIVFTGLLHLLGAAIKCRVKDKDFANTLKEFLLPQPIADDLIRALTMRFDFFNRQVTIWMNLVLKEVFFFT